MISHIMATTSTASPGAAANLSSISGWAPSAGAPLHAHKTIVSGKAIEELFVVLAVMTVLGIVASMVGRMCGGRHLGGDSPFDFEGWVEKQCAVCIDGELEAPPAPEGEPAPPLPEGEPVPPPPPPELLPPPPPPDAPPPPPDAPAPAPAPAPEGMAQAQAQAPYHPYYYHYPMPMPMPLPYSNHNNCRCYYCCKLDHHAPFG